jgi:polyhydroxyalkanoate synthase
VIASDSYWRLRDYGGGESSAALLVIAAPIKRPYIWDLSPSASAIRYCLGQRLPIYMIEWLPASHDSGNNGLDDYARAIAGCVAKVSDPASARKPFLIGHSLGGTLAAIFAALASETLSGLVLLSAPLCFEPQPNGFRDALVSLVPPNLPEAEPFPGSLIAHDVQCAVKDAIIGRDGRRPGCQRSYNRSTLPCAFERDNNRSGAFRRNGIDICN